MFQLRPYQEEAKQAILREWDEGRRKTLLVLPTGCHAKGEKLLMANGESRAVEDIRVGDRLLGADGTARTVLYRTEGKDTLYRVMPVKGEPFVVTGDHKLTLVRTGDDEMKDVTVREWLEWSSNRKKEHKLVRCAGIRRFEGRDDSAITIDPYFLGLMLGDGGTSGHISLTTMEPEVEEVIRVQAEKYDLNLRSYQKGKARTWRFSKPTQETKNKLAEELRKLGLMNCGAQDKFVPEPYKYASLEPRLQMIAGLLDTDGYLSGNGYDYISKSKQLAEDLAFMCRSVGLAAYISWCFKSCPNFISDYYRVSISGDCDMIPCRVARRRSGRRKQVKSVLRTGFHIYPEEPGEYVGFTVDGDNRYLMEDFTITHNCGKTVVFSSVTEAQVHKGHRVLIMAHRGELLSQAADKLKEATGLDSSLEMAESSSLGSFLPVTVGSVQSLAQEKRLARFPNDYFHDIIVDEAHHCLSESYRRVLDHFPEANVLGVTATPDRGDKQTLGAFFDSQAYEYSMMEAIRDGYLCPVKAQMIPLELDIQNVKMSSGDYSAGEIGHALEPYLSEIAQEMTEYCRDRKTVVFLPLIATSQKFCGMLKERGFRAAEVNGNSEDRAEILADFENGKYDVLCNSMLLTEGWDCPSVDCIVVLRPTKVRSLYQQMVGRGLRLSPGKENLLLLDFLWMTERHDLCRPSALVSRDADIAKKIDERMLREDEGFDLMDAEVQAERDVLADRENALAMQLTEMRGKKRKLVDPLQYALSIAAEDLTSYSPTFAWEMGPPTEKQLQFLESRGIYPDSVENAGLASLLIDRLKRRQEEGLATPKQIRCLERYGFRQVGTWSFRSANSLISALANHNWRIPYGIDPNLYRP